MSFAGRITQSLGYTTLVVFLAACEGKPPPSDAAPNAAVTTAPPPLRPVTPPVEPGVPGVDRPQSGLERGLVVFESKRGEVAVEVEVAQNDDQRRIGLMLRRHLADGRGMLFLMPDQRPHAFWMKNTLIPLDMIFVAEDLRVAGVVARTEPLSLEPRGVGAPSRYVVEVPGGFAERAGITAGDRMRIEGVAALP